MRKWERKNLKAKKKRDRVIRREVHRAKEMLKDMGLAGIIFYKFDDIIEFSYSQLLVGHGIPLLNRKELRKVICSNIRIKDLETGKIYNSFEEYKKELLIVKMLGL